MFDDRYAPLRSVSPAAKRVFVARRAPAPKPAQIWTNWQPYGVPMIPPNPQPRVVGNTLVFDA